MRVCSILLTFLLAATGPVTFAQSQAHTFAVQGDHFKLDGKPFQIISGSIHYERIPRAYWRDRLRKARAMGLNTVETYAFWNAQEPEQGRFDFTGRNDIAEFVREAKQEGLYVILRPGPYACAEWEWGGYPPWLLKDPKMVVRSSYAPYLAAAQDYLKALGKQLTPLQIGNGGPILAVQVENEYGSYAQQIKEPDADAHAYMEKVHQAVLAAGFTKSLLYTADGGDELPQGMLPGLPAAVNFGPGDAQRSFGLYDKLRPGSVHFNSEYWDGWFDHWGAKHETRPTAQQLADLQWMLERGYSINFYMFDGGTSFGWMNGANSNGANADGTTSKNANYEPDVTSYDYDVPIAETGEPRAKFFAFRDVIAKATHTTPPALPAALPNAIETAPIALNEASSVWANLPAPTHSDQPLAMESLGQSYGYILYRTRLNTRQFGTLKLPIMHDYAMVYLDGIFQGAIDRRLNQSTLPLHPASSHARLDILVENTGRVNYGPAIVRERAGILAPPTLNGAPLTGWDNYPLPMLHPEMLAYGSTPCIGACFYRATFTVGSPADTWLDTSRLTKGFMWVNGHPLGRFWNIGPQKTLYLPGPWLKAGANDVVVFDLAGKPGLSVQGGKTPVLDATPSKDALSAAAGPLN
jgi:beta-galactosidase